MFNKFSNFSNFSNLKLLSNVRTYCPAIKWHVLLSDQHCSMRLDAVAHLIMGIFIKTDGMNIFGLYYVLFSLLILGSGLKL